MLTLLLSLPGGAAWAQAIANNSFEINEGGNEVWENTNGNNNRCVQRSGDGANIPDGGEVMEVKEVAHCRSDPFLMTTEAVTFWAAGKDNDDQLAEVAVLPSAGGADLGLWGPVFLDRDSKDSGFDLYSLDSTAACGMNSRVEARNLGDQQGGNGNEKWVIDLVELDYTRPCPEYDDADNDGLCPNGTDLGGLDNCSEPGDSQSASIVDCDDSNNTVYPGAPELCDGLDNDCDNIIDNNLTPVEYYPDLDLDGFGDDSAPSVLFCIDPGIGFATNQDDCDDSDMDVNPDATVVPLDGIDNDCSGGVDECYVDLDGDSYGGVGFVDTANASCTDTGEADNADDCDDSRTATNPGAIEETCNGEDDDCSALTLDAPNVDNDAYTVCDGDCNDALDTVYPGAPIVVGDGQDNDCGGGFDECYADTDGDGYGRAGSYVVTPNASCTDAGESPNPDDCDDNRTATNPGQTEQTCNGEDDDCDVATPDAPNLDADAYSICAGDCDDSDPAINPGATPVVGDNVDNDCSGGADECYRDTDGDGYGTSSIVDSADLDCEDNLEAPVAGDCDDTRVGVNPGAVETTCNGRDDDCSATTPDAPDLDLDGFDICGGNRDCDDTNPDIRPGAPELCDGVDNDCTGAPGADEADADGDGQRICDGDCIDNDASVSPSLPEVACDGKDNDCSTGGVPDPDEVDNDGDGFAECDVQSDCDDTDANINPGESEICNTLDDDCVGGPDDGLPFLDYYPDADNDGYGDEGAAPTLSCQPIPGFVTDATDCDDGAATTYPGAPELCDSIDNDCDGTPDDNTIVQTYYEDVDGDGFGDAGGITVSSCSAQAGFVPNSSDCDDGDPGINPNATELCDAIDWDCDGDPVGGVPELTYYTDVDGDGFGDEDDTNPVVSCAPVPGRVADNTDCNDLSSLVAPGAGELCDNQDNDCDGAVDEGLLFLVYRADVDGDGFGAGAEVPACSTYLDWVVSEIDCNDAVIGINPGANEICDGVDNDCDNAIDEDLPPVEWYADVDEDGFGAGSVTVDCSLPADGASLLSSDCDDNNPFVNPTAVEQCDSIDNNCDSLVDNGVVEVDWFLDLDGDGFGDDAVAPQSSCSAPSPDHVTTAGDCDDTDPNRNPAELETCAPGDEDCDGLLDSDDPDVDAPIWYQDNDGDTFGSNVEVSACEQPAGHVDRSGDCDDASAAVRPGALEICPDGLDNDCDTLIDGADPDYQADPVTFWADFDADGAGTPNGGATLCPGPGLPDLFVLPTGVPDCNDNDAFTYPNAPERCDGVDNDCNGIVDDNVPMGAYETYYPDLDGDGFGDESFGFDYCDPFFAEQAGLIPTGGDCDDDEAGTNPLAEEICGDGTDQDCDGDDPQPFDQWPDSDGDGYGDASVDPVNACEVLEDFVAEGTDCDDVTFEVNPGATEICNDLDDDCDPATPEPLNTYYSDVDLDGVGVEAERVEACEPPGEDWATEYGDCKPNDDQTTLCTVRDTGCGCAATEGRSIRFLWLLRR